MGDPQDIFARALRLEDSLDQPVVLRQRPAVTAPPDSPFFNALTPEKDLESMDAAEKVGQAKAYQRQLDTYTGLKKLAEIKFRDNPAGLEEELQKVQLSMYLGQQLTVDPEQVYRGWNSLGENPYATQYFESKELPKTYFGYMKEDVERAVKTYRAMNIATGLFATPYREGKYDKLLEVLQSIPEDTRPKMRKLGKGGALDYVLSIPQAIISQAPYLADMGLAGIVGQAIGGGIGLLFGPEAVPVGAAAGRQVATLLSGTRLGAASIFMDTMTMVDPESGLPLYKAVKDPRQLEDIARWSSAIWGGVEGAIGMVQFESLIGKGVLKKAATDSLAKGTVRNLISESLRKYGKNVLFQTGSEPVQEIMELIGQDIVAGAMNTKQGMALPRATYQDFARLAATTADVTFRSSLLFTLPGSVIEAKASIAEKIAAWDHANAEKRIQNINHLTDVSRPFTERVVDMDARIEELRKNQADLEKRILAMPDGTFDEATVRAHDVNKAEIDVLEWAKTEEKAKDPSHPYMMSRAEAEAAEAARRPAGAAPLPEAPVRPEAALAVLREQVEGRFQGSPRPRETFDAWSQRQQEYVRAGDEANIVNPIDPTLSAREKAAALRALSEQNAPIIDAALQKVAAELGLQYGVEAKSNFKTPEVITEKASRPSILEKNPAHDVEHVRDSFRFKTVSNTLEDFGRALDIIIKETGAELVKIDTEKLFKPKDWGWRFAGADLRMPNGQLVEYYSPLREMEAAKKAGNHALYDKWRNVSEKEILASPELWKQKTEDQVKSNDVYREAFDAALKRLGIQETTAMASWSKLRASGFGLEESPTREKLAMRSSAEGEPGTQTPALRTSEPPLQATKTRPSPSSLETNQVPDIPLPSWQNVPSGAEWFNSRGELSPASSVVAKIRAGLPNLTVEQAQGAALYAKLIAAHKGMNLNDYIADTFVRDIFSREREKQIEAMGKRGGIDWNAAGKAIFYTTTNSDFGTWVHELTHLFEYDLDAKEKAAVYGWLGATDTLTEDQRERFAYSTIDYIRKGNLPSEDLRPAFDRFARWLNQIYDAKLDWKISPEIVQMYDEALAAQARQPKTYGVDESVMVFETRPEAQQQDPSTLKPGDLMRLTEYDRSIRDVYLDPATGLVRPGISSLTTPIPPMTLTVGQWMIDDGCKGSHGREIAQLRQFNPADLEVSEDLVEQNIQGRGDDAARYAQWLGEGKTAPPISVVETDAGKFKVIDGHRRTAAAIQAGRPILAWVWPTMDHPDPEAVDFYTKKPIKVGLTFEQVTGLVWPGDEKPATVEETRRQMSYEDRPGDKDPWILKSRDIVRQKMRGPQPASAVKAMLEAGGVKAEEMEWLGLNDYLKGNQKLKPEEVLNFIEANAITIKETIYQLAPQDVLDAEVEAQREVFIEREIEKIESQGNQNVIPFEIRTIADGEQRTYALVNTDTERTVENFDTEEEAQSRLDEMQERDDELWREGIAQTASEMVHDRTDEEELIDYAKEKLGQRGYPAPKFDNYTLPGAENYRELLLTLPLKLDREAEASRIMGEDAWSRMHQSQRDLLTASATNPALEGTFRSAHWTEPNVLAHIRFSDRVDSEGKRSLHLEEIQSDWHQKARKARHQAVLEVAKAQGISLEEAEAKVPADVGYDRTAKKPELGPEFSVRKMTQEDVDAEGSGFVGAWGLFDDGDNMIDFLSSTEVTQEQAAQQFAESAVATGVHLEDFGGKSSGIPNAPFKKTWPELAFRRALRWAVENGYDQVTWSTGEQEAALYDLSKQVDQIEVRKEVAGRYVWGASKEGKEIIGARTTNNLAELEDEIGKDLADKAQTQPEGEWKVYSGLDLKIGSEGMVGFYDKQLVNIAKKMAKKYGARVDMVQIGKAADETPIMVHRLEVPDAMKTDVRMGQMLFEPGPHEESVRQAVEQGLPVPDRVLEEYIDREWAQTESDRRLQLAEAARTFANFEDFLDWQARSSSEGFPNRAYYENIWNRSQATDPAPAIQSRNFREAIKDDEAIHYIVGGFAMVHEEDLAAQGVITQEMQELGRRLIQNEDPGDLTQTVRSQLEDNPTGWIRFFDKYLPDDVKADLKTAMLASQEDFVPVAPKVANERFTRNLQREGKLEDFLETVGPYRLQGKSKLLANLAERLRNETDFSIDATARYRAMEEIRKSITTYREALASATSDEDMLRQLYAEADVAVETEEARLKTENQRLRFEMKKAQELVHQVTLKQLWTMKDLETEQKERTALKARYDQDIADAKSKLKLSVQDLRQELLGKTRLTAEVKNTLWKKRMKELSVRNEADLAVLKARVNQVRELGRQRLQAEKDKARIRFYAESINRPVNAGIADNEARLIEDIQARIAYDPEDVPDTVKNKLREWRRRNPAAPMPSDLVQKIEATNPRLISAGEMAKLYEEVKSLRNAGRKRRMKALLGERIYIQGEIKAVSGSIQGTRAPRNLRGYGTKGTLQQTKTPIAKVAMWATWRMNRIAEMLDGGRPGPTTNWLWDQVNDKTDDSIRMVDAYAKENQARLEELRIRARDLGKQESIDGLKITHGQMIGVYVYSQFEDGLFALKEDNRIPEATIGKIIKALSTEEKEYGDWMIDRLSTDTDFDRLQQVQLDVSNTRMDRLRRYFPMQRQGLSGDPLMSELARELLDMAGKTNKPRPRAGFLKSRMERTEGVSFPPLRLDAPAIYMDHISKREFYIANAQLIKRLNRIFDSKEVKAAMADRYGDKMQPLVQKYVAQYSNPNIYRAFEDYGEFARILRGNIGMSLIGSNLVTMLKQLPDIPQIMVMAGPVDGIRAAAQFIANPRQTLQQMWEKAPQLKARSYDRFIEELKTFDRNAYERVVRTVGEAGFAVLKAMDTATNVIGWTAVYNKTMRRTGNENLAVKAARNFILRKRPAARAKDVAAIYRSPGLSWFLMFSNQQNQQWNILTYDIPHSIREGLRGNGGAMVDAALNVTGLLIGAVGMGLIARKGAMSGSDLLEDFLNMLFGNTPFIGNAIEAAIRGQPAQDALNPFAGAYQMGKIAFDVANQADTEKVMRDLQNALFTLAGTAGFPVVQARRIYKTIDSGDPWDLIGGPPKKEK